MNTGSFVFLFLPIFVFLVSVPVSPLSTPYFSVSCEKRALSLISEATSAPSRLRFAFGEISAHRRSPKSSELRNASRLIPCILPIMGSYRELSLIREQGYGFDREESEYGLFCIAAPIRDANDNVIAAISISGPAERMKRNLEANLAQVRRTAEKISAEIG